MTDGTSGGAAGRPRLVLFDVVGTLLEVEGGVGAAYARFARRHGSDLDAGVLEASFRRTFREVAAARPAFDRPFWREVVRRSFGGVPGGEPLAASDLFFESLWSWFGTAEPWRVFPEVFRGLQRLRDVGLALGVVSNFDERLPGLLDATDLLAFFDAVTLPGDAGAAKPDRLHFEAALRRHGVAAALAVHVGDDPEEDFAAARAAGLGAILLDRSRGDTLLDVADRILGGAQSE